MGGAGSKVIACIASWLEEKPIKSRLAALTHFYRPKQKLAYQFKFYHYFNILNLSNIVLK